MHNTEFPLTTVTWLHGGLYDIDFLGKGCGGGGVRMSRAGRVLQTCVSILLLGSSSFTNFYLNITAAMLPSVCKPADIIIFLLFAIQIEFIDTVAYGSFNLNAPTSSIIEYDTHKLMI